MASAVSPVPHARRPHQKEPVLVSMEELLCEGKTPHWQGQGQVATGNRRNYSVKLCQQ